MYFSNIELYNYGIYRGHHNIALRDQEGDRNITLIGGLNGRGKTTILDSVFLALYGRRAVEFIAGKKIAYSKFLRDRINKSAEDGQAGIKLTIHMDDEEGTILTVHRSWSQKDRKIDTSLVIEKNGIKDDYLSENWDYYVEELVPYGIAQFFFFDNEKISQIADDTNFEKIKDSIKSVMGITTIESLCTHIAKIQKDKVSKMKKLDTSHLDQDSDEILHAMELNEEKTRELYSSRAALVPELEKTCSLLEQTEQDFWKQGGNLGIDRENIINDQAALKEKAGTLKEEALSLAADPAAPLGLCRDLVSETYSRIESEEETRARRYARPIVTDMYRSLLSEFQNMFSNSSDAGQTLESLMNAQLKDLESESEQESSGVFTSLSHALMEDFLHKDMRAIAQRAHELIQEDKVTQAALDQLDVHLSSNAEKDDAVELLERMKELQTQIGRLEANIAQIDEKIRSASFEKDQLERRQNEILLEIANSADADDDDARILEYSTITLEIMHEYEKRLQAQKVEQFEKDITLCFDFLSQKLGIITSISIDPETLDITLRDYNGGILLKEQLSAGEKQIFAISILWGLALASGYKLPVIIDTPMARLDSAHRSNFINQYLPNASSQVIVLSTDEEISGKYLEDISSHVLESYTLVYDEQEKCSSIEPGYFGGKKP